MMKTMIMAVMMMIATKKDDDSDNENKNVKDGKIKIGSIDMPRQQKA